MNALGKELGEWVKSGKWNEAAEVALELIPTVERKCRYEDAVRMIGGLLDRAPDGVILKPVQTVLRVYRMRCHRVLRGAMDTLTEAVTLVLEALDRPEEVSATSGEAEDFYQAALRQVRSIPSSLRHALKHRNELGDELLSAISFAAEELAVSLGNLNEFALQRQILSAVEPVYRALSDDRGLAHSLHYRASIEADLGSYAEARNLITRSLNLKRKKHVADRQGEAASLVLRAHIDFKQGKHPKALRGVRSAFRMQDEIGDLRGKLVSCHLLAQIELQQDNLNRARKHLEEAQDVLSQVNDRQAEAAVLHLLAYLEYGQGDYKEARRILRQAMEIEAEIGARKERAKSLAQLGIWAHEAGEIDQAEQYLETAHRELEKLGAELEVAQVQVELGMVVVRQKPAIGLRMVRQGIEELELLGHPSTELKRQQLEKLGQSTLAAVRVARMDCGSEELAELSYEEGACALLVGAVEEAIEPLRTAMNGFGKQRWREETQAAWALSKALALTGRAKDAKEASELARNARAKARGLNMKLPWFPEVDMGFEQRRREIRRLLRDIAEIEHDPEMLVDEMTKLLSLLKDLPDPPEDQAELVVKELFQNGGLRTVVGVMPTLLNLLSQDLCDYPLGLALRDELRHMGDVLNRELDRQREMERVVAQRKEIARVLRIADSYGEGSAPVRGT